MTGTGLRSIIVVGAALAGLTAARALREQGFDGRLTLVGAERHRPYDRPPLSKDFLAGRCPESELALELPDEELAVQWRLGVPAVGLDRSAGAVRLADGSALTADGVVLATGAAARQLPGATALTGVHLLRTLDDARALRADLATATRLVVVGAGFIGAEVAGTARALGLEVTVLEAAPTPLSAVLGVEMGATLATLHEAHGVRLSCGVGVAELTSTGRVDGARRSDGGRADGARPADGAGRVDGVKRVDGVRLVDGSWLPADVVLVGIGARAETDWLVGSGVSLGGGALGNGVLCDAAGGTGIPNVVAVGDCAAWYDPRLGRHVRVEHWTAALERPRLAVRTLLGAQPPGGPPRLPYFWSDQYGRRIQFAGHAEPGDTVEVVTGDPTAHRFVAVYRRAGRLVAALGVDQVGPFTRWRKELESARPDDVRSAS